MVLSHAFDFGAESIFSFVTIIASSIRNLTKAEEKCKSLEDEITENDEVLRKIDVRVHFLFYSMLPLWGISRCS